MCESNLKYSVRATNAEYADLHNSWWRSAINSFPPLHFNSGNCQAISLLTCSCLISLFQKWIYTFNVYEPLSPQDIDRSKYQSDDNHITFSNSASPVWNLRSNPDQPILCSHKVACFGKLSHIFLLVQEWYNSNGKTSLSQFVILEHLLYPWPTLPTI